MKRRYWVVSPNVSNNPIEESLWKEIITEKHLAFMGWGLNHEIGRKFVNEIQIGDFILIAQGANRKKKLFLGGIVSSEAKWEHYHNTLDPSSNRKLHPCLEKRELEKLQLDFKDSAFGDADRIPALYELHPYRNNADKKIVDKIEFALKLKIQEQNMQDKIDLLKYKKQIILQGPPGTGKTRLAKMIARDLTKAQRTLTPHEYIEYYIQQYTQSTQSVKYDEFFSEKLNEFTNEFPKESIINLTLEKYCLGRGLDKSFCYWIEKGLKDVGRFSTGLAGTTVYGVYYSKDESQYISVIDGKTPEEAINIIREALSDLILNENYTKARELFRFSFILKILNSYYPDNYFPIVSHRHLVTVAKIFNLDVKGSNDIEINQKIKEKFLELKTKYNSPISKGNLMGHLYEKFKIKEDQIGNIVTNQITEIGETQLIQFHPAYTYEDFVRGIVVETNVHNQPEYKVVNKTLASFAKKALDNPTANYVLIIDEINRANLPSVLGELIYALEYRYDEKIKNDKEAAVESIYALKENEDDEFGNKTLLLPTNLYIIGTMNTADRSVGHIDYAIKRRFAFVNVLPTDQAIDDVITDAALNKKAKDLYNKVENLFNEDNNKTVYLQSDFKAKDVQLGHSYFLAETEKQLELKLEFEIKPLLHEYAKDGILSEEAIKEIESLIL